MISPSAEATSRSEDAPGRGSASRSAPREASAKRGLLAILISDIALINVAFALGYVARYRWQLFRDIEFNAAFSDYWPIQVLFTLAVLAFFWLDGAYARRRTPSWLDQMWTITGSVLKAMFIVWVAIFIYGPAVYSRLLIAEAGMFLVALLGVSRAIKNAYDAHQRARGIGVSNVLIVGAGEFGRAVMRTLFARPDLGYRCIGFVDDDPRRGHTDIGRFPALGEVDALSDLLRRYPVDDVVITLPWSAQPKILELIEICRAHHVRVHVAPSLLQINLRKLDVNDFGGIPMLSPRDAQDGIVGMDWVVKRSMDVVFGGILLLLSLPVVAIACLAIRLESPGPVIFTQLRAGKNGKPFKLYKLRSMYKDADQMRDQLMAMNEADGPIFKIKDDPRRTKVGRLLRKLSIDELPQFWNVLKGDMSIVGPRPALLSEVAQYADWHRERLRVQPGITGLWQISGRSELSFDEMCLLDVYYIENWSPSLDLKIMLRTIPYVLTGRGAY
ncbi:MAG: UDP-phosphate galactose phosphotransferase [Candidatus Roseilinea sp.]|nr:MAG: UDP-phosphate galactose phosphotransferase [Candidatus Roseilinea sp.]